MEENDDDKNPFQEGDLVYYIGAKKGLQNIMYEIQSVENQWVRIMKPKEFIRRNIIIGIDYTKFVKVNDTIVNDKRNVKDILNSIKSYGRYDKR